MPGFLPAPRFRLGRDRHSLGSLPKRTRPLARGQHHLDANREKCLPWPGRDWLRKGFEAWFTALIELAWGKRRIMEVYLNVAEWGPGVYGAEAAAQYYFHK